MSVSISPAAVASPNNAIAGPDGFTIVHKCNAQVYVLDKVNKNWSPVTQTVVMVHFATNESTQQSKILSPAPGTANSPNPANPVFETIIQSNTIFKKSGDAFVQWYDTANKQMFGLNMKSKQDATKLEELFQDAIKKAPKNGSVSMKKEDSAALKNASSDDQQANSPQTNSLAPANNAASNIAESSLSPAGASSVLSSVTGTLNAHTSADFKVEKKSNKLMDYVANMEQQLRAENDSGDQKILNVLETKIKYLEDKIALLEANNSDLKETIQKTEDSFQKKLALMTKDNELLKVALHQQQLNSETSRKQTAAYQEINSKLAAKLTAISKLYDNFGDILSQE